MGKPGVISMVLIGGTEEESWPTVQTSGSQSLAPRLAAPPRSLLTVHILWLYSRVTELKTLGSEPSNSHLTSPPGDSDSC